MAPSRTVISPYAPNGQMRSKAHTVMTAPLFLHHIRIYKRAMKIIIINGQIRNKLFLIAIYHSSLVKAAKNAARVCKCATVLAKRPQFLLFSTFKGRMNILRSYLNCSTIVKKQGSALIMKRALRGWERADFSKNLPRLSL
jgi:hypothetical protein